jgi:hypothetical protein
LTAVHRQPNGGYYLCLSGNSARRAREAGITRTVGCPSHGANLVAAVVVALWEGRPDAKGTPEAGEG